MSLQIPGGTPPADSSRTSSSGGVLALLWLAGIPPAVGLLIGWQFVVQTSAEYNRAERITGGSALLRDLPATVLLFAPVALGLVLGVRAARQGSASGRAAIWLHGVGLFAVSWIAVSSMLGELRPESSTALEKALLPAEFAVDGFVVILCRRAAARPVLSNRRGAVGRLAVVLPALTLLGAAAWLTTAQATLTHHVGGFVRSGVPDPLAFNPDQGAEYVVYAEGNATAAPNEPTVSVTGPTGSSVPWRATKQETAYLLGWRGGWPIATFRAAESGRYEVQVGAGLAPVDAPFAPEHALGTVAVGNDVTTWMRQHEWGSAALVLAGLLVGTFLAAARTRSQLWIQKPDIR